MSKRSLKDIIDETEAIINAETLRDFDKKRIEESKVELTYEVSKVIAPLKKAVPDFNLHLKNFRDYQREEVKKKDQETQAKLKANIDPLVQSCLSLRENMSNDSRSLGSRACDMLADAYTHLKAFDPITQNMYDMFSNSCKYGTSFRTCDTVEYLHYTILEKEKKGEFKPNSFNIHNNISEFLKTRLSYFDNRCKNEKDGFACEQMVSYSGAEGKVQLDYAKRSCDYGNKTGCELMAEILVSNNNDKDALTYYKKACDLGEGRACISAMMIMMPNAHRHEKEIQEFGRKSVKSKFCLPSVNPQFFVAPTEEEAYSNYKQGCEDCNDASACLSYATLKLTKLSQNKNAEEEARKFEMEELPCLLMKACAHTSLLSNPFLIEPCLSVYLHATNALPTHD